MHSTLTVKVPASGFSTRVLVSGAGAPVLLLHGTPDTATEWLRVMEALGGGYRCIAPDLPGLGRCDEPPASFDFSHGALEAFLDELLAAVGIREPVLLAVHDIGGAIGVPWAGRRPERVRGVVITNTVVFPRFDWFAMARLWARTDPIGRLRAGLVMFALGLREGRRFREAFGRISPELDPEDLDRMTREFALDPKSKASTLRLFRKMVPHAFFEGVDELTRDLVARVPVHVVWGRGDPYIPERYADAFPGAEREVIGDGGHWIPISAPERVAAAIRSLPRA